MSRIIFFLLAATAVFAAEDSWNKVKDLKSGTELRIYKRGVKQPVMAKFDELNDENLVVATKSEQVAIAKADIDRIDYRPMKSGNKPVVENKTTTSVEPPTTSATAPHNAQVPSTSSSSSLSFGKPEFEVLYRRSPVTSAK